MRAVVRWVPLFALFFVFSCKTARQSTRNVSVDENGVMDITLSDITKDAIRLKGEIVKSNGQVDKGNSYEFKVEQVVKYGATFSSVEPKIGEIINLTTPKDVSFDQGQVIIIDVLTPRFGQGAKPMRVRLGQP